MRFLLFLPFLFTSFLAQAGELPTVSDQLAKSNDLRSLYSCSIAIGLVKKSADANYVPTAAEVDSMNAIDNAFGQALELKGDAVGRVDLSKFTPDWLTNSESPQEMVRANISEYKYCLSLHKIAVLERMVDYLRTDSK